MTADRRGTESAPDEPGTDETPEPDVPSPSDAFGALGGETRLDVVRALDDDAPLPFSELFDATDEDTSAGFAYHLRQLTDRFVRQRDDERYELTDAGRSAARALNAGTYTTSVDRDPIDLDDDCPFCRESALAATVHDNVAEITCDACGAPVLRLSVPPGGLDGRDPADVPDALDTHHRRRIESFSDGVCPDCAGTVATGMEVVAEVEADESATSHGRASGSDPTESANAPLPVQVVFECETCSGDLRCPVSLTLLGHPAVVAFYHDHARDVRDRPIWNVGTEWRERVVSRDPWCVVVSVRLDGEDLVLYVAGDGTVVDYRRPDHDDSETPGRPAEVTAPDETGTESESGRSPDGDRHGEDGGTEEAVA
ncbi:ArsR/SmtB family transcription factor [Halosimplex sp. J119]